MKLIKSLKIPFLLIFALFLLASCTITNTGVALRIDVERNIIAGETYELGIKSYSDTLGSDFTWKVGDPEMLEIDPVNNIFRGLKAGKTTLTVEANTGEKASVVITIEEATVYKIQYELNGGRATGLAEEYNKLMLPVALPDATKEYYTFDGWYIDNEKVTEIAVGANSDLTVVAKYTPSKFVVTYNLDGGTATGLVEEYTIESEEIVLPEPTKVGFTFLGWYEDETKLEKIEAGSHRDIQLVAKYEISTYSINYELNGGVLADLPTSYKTTELPISLAGIPTKANYQFDGWYINNVKVTEIAVGTIGNISIEARFVIDKYSITYVLDGGEAKDLVNEYTIETEDITLPIATKNGYKFLGWYEGDTKVEKIAKGSTGNKELTAKFEIENYSITYVLAGGKVSDLVNEYNINTEDITLPIPTKDGYNFLGWYENGNKVEKLVKGSIGNKEFVAKWEEIITGGIILGEGGYATLKEAYDAAKDGDTIIVKAGTYKLTEQFIIAKSLTFVGPNALTLAKETRQEEAVFGTNNSAYFVITASNVTFKGIRIAGDPATEAAGIHFTNASNLTLTNCYFSDFNSFLRSSASGKTLAGELIMKDNKFENIRQFFLFLRASEYPGLVKIDFIGNYVTGTKNGSTSATAGMFSLRSASSNLVVNAYNNYFEGFENSNNFVFRMDSGTLNVNYNTFSGNACYKAYVKTITAPTTTIDFNYNLWLDGNGATLAETPTYSGVTILSSCVDEADRNKRYQELSGTYRIVYDLNGGTSNNNMVPSYVFGVGVENLPAPTYEGYVFVHYVDKDGNVVKSISTEATGIIELTAIWREDAIYVGDADYAYATLAEALEKAAVGDKIIVLPGTYSENVTISKGVLIVGPNMDINPNTETRKDEAIFTGTITIGASNVILNGLAFTQTALIKSGSMDNFKFLYNYVYDTNKTSVAWAEGTNSSIGFMKLFGTSNAAKVTNTEFGYNYFKNVGDTVISMQYVTNVTLYGSVFEDFLYEGIRFNTGGENCGALSFTNNEFIQNTESAYVGIYFRIYGSVGRQDTEIYIQNNTFKNIGYGSVSSIYKGAIGGRNYQESGAIINIKDNIFDNCYNYIRIRNNGHSANTWTCLIENNEFHGLPNSYYYANLNGGSDTTTSNPVLTEFGPNLYLDDEGTVMTTVASSYFADCLKVADPLTEITFNKAHDMHYYTVEYDFDGGVSTASLMKIYNDYSKEYVLPIPTKEDYIFLGWYINDVLTTSISGANKQNLKLVAKWKVDESSYANITYNLNDGNWYFNTREQIVSEFLKDYKRVTGVTVAADTIYAGGNYFGKFFSDEEMVAKYMWIVQYLYNLGAGTPAYGYHSESQAQYKTFLAGNGASVTTQWAVRQNFQGFMTETKCGKYSGAAAVDFANYDLANGFWTVLTESQANEAQEIQGVEIVLPTPYKRFYEFKGWYDNPEFAGEALPETYKPMAETINLYAKWEEAVKITDITVKNPITELLYRDELQLQWEIVPTDASNPLVKFSSTNPSVVSVSSTGLLTALNEGTTTVRVFADANPDVYKEMVIEVYRPDRVEAEYETESYVEIGQSINILAEYKNRKGLSGTLVWESLNDSVATVSQTGVVTGVASGNAVIKVTESTSGLYMELGVTVLGENLSDALKLIVDAHNSEIYYTENMRIADAYNTDIYGSVSKILYNTPLEITERMTPLNQGNRPGTKLALEFITVHYTGNPGQNSGASANATYFQNSSDVSIHYVTGNDGVFHTMPDDEVAYHAGDGTKVAFEWLDTGVTAIGDTPAVFTISTDGYFEINGQKTIIPIPKTGTRSNGTEVTLTSWSNELLTLLGPAWKIVDGTYYMGKTWLCFTQVYAGKISSYGGNLGSIGIESACNEKSDLWLTWQKTAQLVAKLMEENNLDITRVKPHNFYSGKNCPQPMLENDGEIWFEFIKNISCEYELRTKFANYTTELVSGNTDIVSNTGRVVERPGYSTVVEYTVNIGEGANQESITLYSLVPGTYK